MYKEYLVRKTKKICRHNEAEMAYVVVYKTEGQE